MTLCVIPNSYLKRAFLKLNYLHQETKRCPEKALRHHAIALMSLALSWMSKLRFPCGKLGLQRHVATSWFHMQLEAKYKGLTLPGKTPVQRGNCCVHIPCLIQNLPPQLASCSFCFQNLSVQMGCGYDNRDQGKEEKKNPQQPSLLHLLLYTSDIAN